MPGLFDTLPFRAVRGFFGGMEDGLRGKMDVNRKFLDGKWTDDPAKKSRAGRFLSENSGIRGGLESGRSTGKWGGALIGGGIVTHFLVTTAMFGFGFAFSPIVSGAIMVAGTAWACANIGAFAGRHLGQIGGGIFGAIAGAFVGTYNAVFKRGAYRENNVPPPLSEPVIAPTVAAPALPEQARAQAAAAVASGQVPPGIASGSPPQSHSGFAMDQFLAREEQRAAASNRGPR